MGKAKKPAPDKGLPAVIETEEQLDELLSRPSAAVIDLFKRLKGDLAIIGGGGKIGPSLVAMACRARDAAGGKMKIVVVDRFPDPAARERVEQAGAEAVACDLLDPEAVKKLPDAPNVVYMVGMKFGTGDKPWLTWAVNGLVPDYVGRRFRGSRIVAFSTACVYPLTPAAAGQAAGSRESDPLEPPGEYCNSCVARERVFEYAATLHRTPMVMFRLCYALELRYGVVVDIASQIAAGQPVDVSMGYFNGIWQGDTNEAALRLLEQAAYPPVALNVSGPEVLSTRQIALRLGELMGKPVKFVGAESSTALLVDTTRARGILGEPAVPAERVVEWVAHWIKGGGRLLGKPTHFQTSDGRY